MMVHVGFFVKFWTQNSNVGTVDSPNSTVERSRASKKACFSSLPLNESHWETNMLLEQNSVYSIRDLVNCSAYCWLTHAYSPLLSNRSLVAACGIEAQSRKNLTENNLCDTIKYAYFFSLPIFLWR